MIDETTRSAILEVRAEAARQGINATFLVHKERSHLMRIGNSSVSLNTSEDLVRLDVSVTAARCQGSHTRLGRISGPPDVREALRAAVEKAEASVPKDYEPLSDIVESPIHERDQYDEGVAEMDPAVKANAYREMIDAIGDHYNYSGSWSSGATEIFLVTSLSEAEAWHLGTDQQLTVVLKHPVAGWELRAVQSGWRTSDVRIGPCVGELQRLLRVYENAEAEKLNPGKYTVLLGAEAVADIVSMASWSGLTGRSWEERQGWTAGTRIGNDLLGANVSLVDDPEQDQTYRFGFDRCGRTRRPLRLVDRGALSGLMYDAGTAAKYGREPTGHDLQSISLTMEPGDGPADPVAAVADRDRVVYIPALHYTNMPNRSEGVFTGSSRFNAVLVESGRVTRPVFSSRVTDQFADVFSNISVLGSVCQRVDQSNTYGRRSPRASSVPAYAVVEGVSITDCADSF